MLAFDGLCFSGVALFSVIAAKVERRRFRYFGLPLRAECAKRLGQGFAWGLLIASLDLGVTYLLGGVHFEGFGMSSGDCWKFGVLWALAFIVVALFEETLYRGYALTTLGSAVGFWPAAVLLSALFAGLHLLNPGETLVGALDVLAYALLACYTLRQTGNLWFAVGLHAAWDFSITALYSVPTSGMQANNSLPHTTLAGPTWLTGGTDGPEGSLVGLLGLAGSFLAFRVLLPRTALLLPRCHDTTRDLRITEDS